MANNALRVDSGHCRPAGDHQDYQQVRMGIEQHLVTLARVRNQPECATGAQLRVGDLNASKQAADQQPSFAPVKLKGFTEGKRQRHKSA